MANAKTKLSTVVEGFQELDLIFKTGSNLDVVERGYGQKLIHAISSQNELLECEALKGLGDLYLHKAKMDLDKVENFNKACSLYMELLQYYKSTEEKQLVEHRVKYAEKSLKLAHNHRMAKLCVSDSILPVSMTLHKVIEETKLKGHGTMPLIEGYTDSLVNGIVEKNKCLEIESLKSLGDLYLEKGRIGKDKAAFTKSAGLYRAALERCEDSDGIETLRHRFKYGEKVQEIESKKAKIHQEMGHHRINGREGNALSDNSIDITQESTDSKYQNQLQEGCRALQTGDLDTAEHFFAAALKTVHLRDSNQGQHWKEVEPLCKLSDVYLMKGIVSKDGADFTKAAALSNAALVRAKTEDSCEAIKQTIQMITQSFVKHIISVKQTVPFDDVKKHKSILMESRCHVEVEIRKIEQQIDPYSMDDDHPKIREVEKNRVEAIKALFDTIVHQRRTLISGLVDECIEVMGPPPCKYAMIGLGSQATGLVTPYSDLEFAILIEKEADNVIKYFHNLTHYLHLKVINLGETILPAMAIKSLNDFESGKKSDDWFYDSVTPRGLSFDGAMPHACKTPLGRGKTCLLIRTPPDMAKVLEDDITLHLKKGYHLAIVLGNVSLITGEQYLVDEHMNACDQQLKKNGMKLSTLLANTMLEDNTQTFERLDLTARMFNVKKEIYRFSSLAVSCWALFCNIQPTTIWETIQKMQKKGAINSEDAHHLMVLVSISAELRLRTYMNNRGQMEQMSALSSMPAISDIEEISKTVFYISNTKQLMRYYYTAMPLKHCLLQFGNRPLPTAESSILFDNSPKLQAEVYLTLCDYQKSKTYTKQALHKMLLKYGNSATHPDIADLLNCLGKACYDLGESQEAIRYFEQSLQMMQSIHGERTAHPNIATLLNNLGATWSHLGDHRKAISYHEQTIQMKQSIYGENTAHAHIADSLENLGSDWKDLGDHRKAISYYEQALQMRQSIHTVHGENTAHPDIAKSLNNLGSAWGYLGDHRKALSYYEQSLEMRRSIYGEITAHPQIASSLTNLGITWINLGEHRKALSYNEQGLKMMLRIYGENTPHPDIAVSLSSLGNAWGDLGEHRKAIRFHEQSLQMRRSIVGAGTVHPDITNSLNYLGNAWRNIGDYKKAISYYEQALKMSYRVHGMNTTHPDIALSLNNLGTVLGALGDHIKAVSYFEQALQMYQSIYGESAAHPYIVDSLNNLCVAWRELGDLGKAVSYYYQATEMNQRIES